MSFNVVFFLCSFLVMRQLQICFMSTGCEGLPGHSSILLWRISLGDGKCGPISCDMMLSRSFFY